MKKTIVILVILLLLTANLIYAEKKVIRIAKPNTDDVGYILGQKFDIAAFVPDRFLDLVVNETEISQLTQNGINFTVTQTEQELKNNLTTAKERDSYHTYEDMLEELSDYEMQYPNICKLYDIGDSWGKDYEAQGNANYAGFSQEIWALKVSDNVLEEEDEPNIYYLGEHHAREPISLEVVMAIIEDIVTNYGSDTEITDNVNSSQIWFVPLVNPNGHKIVMDQVDVWWRKNIRDNNENGSFDFDADSGNGIDGVDPNRNYGWQWGLTGASDDWNAQTYHGPNAWSEPEIQAIKNLTEAHHFIAGISYHSYSELVLFPFGYANNVIAPDHDALQSLAIAMGTTIPSDNTPSGHYTPQESWQLYPCMGTTDDYSYGEHGIFSYTIELGTQFIPPEYLIDDICDDNLEAARILLNRKNHDIMTGHIIDAVSGEPVIAEIYVDGVDNTGVYRKPYNSDEEYGSYYRFLETGNYTVTFSSYGYLPQTVEVHIDSDTQTVYDVAMEHASMENIYGTVINGNSSEPMEDVTVDLYSQNGEDLLTTTLTNANGYFLLESIPLGNYKLKFSSDGFSTTILDIVHDTQTSLFVNMFEQNIIGFENEEFAAFVSYGDANWELVSDESYGGNNSLKSGDISAWQSSGVMLDASLEQGGEISFYQKVSTENGYDFVKFYIDEDLQGQWSGVTDWSEINFPINGGEHILKWIYEKDGYVDEGEDCIWLDNIALPGGMEINPLFNPPQNLVVDHSYQYPVEPYNLFTLQWEAPNTSNRTLSGYKIYRNFNELATVEPEIMTFEDGDPPLMQDDLVYYYITALYDNPDGESVHSNIYYDGLQTSSDETNVNMVTKLGRNFPNPFNPITTISFSVSQNNTSVKMNIYNLKGQLVKNLISKTMDAGKHNVQWNGENNYGRNCSSGVYYYRLQTKDYDKISKMVLLK